MIIKDLKVWPMKISHDAAEPVGYRVGYGDKKVAVCTDLGTFDDYTVACLTGLDALLLEANHDVNMLQVGPYPYYLKQRILGNRGHLSNENAGRLLDRVLNDKIQAIMLGHLSKENNMPELAHEAVRMESPWERAGTRRTISPFMWQPGMPCHRSSNYRKRGCKLMKTLVCAFCITGKNFLGKKGENLCFGTKLQVCMIYLKTFITKSIPGDRHSGGKADKYKR